MATEPLQNLTEQSARIGSWLLLVATKPRPQDYTWTCGSTTSSGRKIEVLLVSQDSTQYCLGQFTRKGKEPAATKAFNEATDKFKKGSVWRVNKISGEEGPKILRLFAQSRNRPECVQLPTGIAEHGYDARAGNAT